MTESASSRSQMGLTAGQRLGPYEVAGPLGAGGMGEVYRARDTRLQRDVAIKVLPAGLSADSERLERFEQEARAAAALNHPNILAVHDVGRHEASPFIVSELLDGATLRQEIASGPVPPRTAIDYAMQVAHGLAAAHEKGIVHRDLKPENVFVTADGRVKILDFGLAKLTQPDPSLSGVTAMATTSPLSAAGPDTVPGAMLGTLGYMAPEQLRGSAVDHRADIFALGALLYEMLAGHRPFRGESPADVISAILKEHAPDLPVSERAIPPGLARIVDRCLEKKPAMRFQSARDLAFALEAITGQSGSHVGAAAAMPMRTRQWAPLLSWILATVATIAASGIAVIHFREEVIEPPLVRFTISSPGTDVPQGLALSRDGRQLAFTVPVNGVTRLWIRALDTLAARELPGTDGATYPFWSPDGKSIAYFAQRKLQKVAVAGGTPVILCDATAGRGGTWNRNDVILFSPGPANHLMRVSASGGTPTTIGAPPSDDASGGQRFPVFLPDGWHFLFLESGENAGSVYVGSLDGRQSVRLLDESTNALFVSTGGTAGFLLFRQQQTLMARPFDTDRLTFDGDAFPIAQDVPDSSNIGVGAFSASEKGTLVYRSSTLRQRELVWRDRAGNRVGAIPQIAAYIGQSLSPDGKKVATSIGSFTLADIWIHEVDRDARSRLSFEAGFNRAPVWSPDATRVAYTSLTRGAAGADLVIKPVGSGGDEFRVRAGVNAITTDWSSDGKWVVFQQDSPNGGSDIWLLPLDGSRTPKPFLNTPAIETNPRFAPSSGAPQWIAYQSSESGRDQVFVTGFPPSTAKYQISTDGGANPRWRRDAKELYYVTNQKLVAVPITIGTTVEAGRPEVLFDYRGANGFVPSSDGRRFLLNLAADAEPTTPLMTVVLNWTSEFKK